MQMGFAAVWAIMIILSAAGAGLYWIVRRRGTTHRSLQKLVRAISHDTLVDVIIPDGAGGEIHIDHLLLTHRGLILLETRDVNGMVFAGDKMDTWSATHEGRRVTFENPIPLLHNRVAALKFLAPGVPIETHVLFTNQASFPKGHPSEVATMDQLAQTYQPAARTNDFEPFSEHWQAIKNVATAA